MDGVGPAPPPGQPRSAAGRGVQGPRQAARSAAVDPGPGGRLAVTQLLARVGGSSFTRTAPAPTKEAAMSTWLWVLIIVVVLVLAFGVMRRRGR
jgi:hypothetical protein